jgi:hypothetical protein
MFKKIHSNRDPKDTLSSELRKEFAVYFEKGAKMAKRICCNYPRLLFSFMVSVLIVSLVLAVSLHRYFLPQEKIRPATGLNVRPLTGGFSQIMAAGQALEETIRLKHEVDSITAKKTLSMTDSTSLLKDLDSLQHIRITINH